MTLNQEQESLREELIERFGMVTFTRATEMSGLRYCLQALACDDLSKEERAAAYVMAGAHLAKLHSTYITNEQSLELTECARRMDAAIDTWLMDDLERREGLPPMPRL